MGHPGKLSFMYLGFFYFALIWSDSDDCVEEGYWAQILSIWRFHQGGCFSHWPGTTYLENTQFSTAQLSNHPTLKLPQSPVNNRITLSVGYSGLSEKSCSDDLVPHLTVRSKLTCLTNWVPGQPQLLYKKNFSKPKSKKSEEPQSLSGKKELEERKERKDKIKWLIAL